MVIVGPTAAGKSSLAMALAAADSRIELVSADSMQVYRSMDIGTAKPTAEEQAAVRHHVIDVVEPEAEYTVSCFVADVARAVLAVEKRGGRPVLVGGTGLYVRAVVDDLSIPGQFPDVRAELEGEADTAALYQRLTGLDPVAAGRMEPTNRRRIVRALEVTIGSGIAFSDHGPGLAHHPDVAVPQVFCDRDRVVLDERIARRYADQMEAGFLDEVSTLIDRPGELSRTAAQALGYKELIEHLQGRASLDDALALADQRTRRFARRQQKWFRRDPRMIRFDLDSAPTEELVTRCVELMGD